MNERLKELDGLQSVRSAQQKEFEQLRTDETALLAQEGGDHEKKLVQLRKIRDGADLKAAAVGQSDQRIALEEEKAVVAAETTGQLIAAFKQGSIAAYYDRLEKQSAEFFLKEDFVHLRILSGRTQAAKQLEGAIDVLVSPQMPQNRALDLSEARRLADAFASLEKAAESLNVEIDIPPQWVD